MKWIRTYFIPLLILLVLVTSQCGIKYSVNSIIVSEFAQQSGKHKMSLSGQQCSTAREAVSEVVSAVERKIKKTKDDQQVNLSTTIASAGSSLLIPSARKRTQNNLYLLYQQLKLTDC